MTDRGTAIDRASAVRRAMCTLVARHGFHGAPMSAVANAAGVATGTAYVHYESKDALVLATYLEIKRDLGDAARAGIDDSAPPAERFRQLWFAIHDHLAADPDRARFLVQVDSSPYASRAHELSMSSAGDPLMIEATRPDMVACLTSLPITVLYDLGIGPAVRLAANGVVLDETNLRAVADAAWRAITLAP
jgi:TetR/AcrR family transcriptional repressor of multidrug resistance operon